MVNLINDSKPITDFYAGKSVFITGGTGFIGKVLVEKLLYSCRGLDKIYLLVREKKNVTSDRRVQDIIDKPVFDRIKKENPQVLKKLVPVNGDITVNNLGINSDDEKLFIDKVSVVFHSAANVGFKQRLDIAVNNNFEATKRVLSLCRRMTNLKSFVYVSTAFTNPQNPELAEAVYPPPVGVKELQAFIDQNGMDDEQKLAKLLGGRPNTYTFTKALTENYVATNHGDIPTAIIRPSIVTSATEPIGWIEGWTVANAMVAGTSLGYNRVIVGNGSNVFDLIPVDYVTNLAIVAAANNNSKSNLAIFNSCTSSCNPLTLKDTKNIIVEFAKKNGYNDLFPPFSIITKDGMMKEILIFFLEKLPALWMQTIGRKPRYENVYSRVSTSREYIKYFTSRSFNMSAEKTIALSRSLSEKDRTIFPFNPQQLNWKQYLPVYCQGVRRFLLRK